MKTPQIIVSILIIALISPGLNDQNANLDSLINLLDQHPQEDTLRVNLLNDVIYNMISNDPQKALSYAEEMKQLSEKLDFKRGKARSLSLIGVYHYFTADYPDAMNFYQKTTTNHNCHVYSSSEDLGGSRTIREH